MKSVTKWIVLLNPWTCELNVDTGMHKKRKLILCVPKMQIALVSISIQRKIKFNVGHCEFAPTHCSLVTSFPGYEIAQLLIFIFFLVGIKKKTIPLHCVTSGRQSCFSDFRHTRSVYSITILALLAITISDSILAIDISIIWIVQNVHLLCILISTHLLHFMTTEIASILRQCFDLVNYSLSSVGGLHASSSLVWNTANCV